MIYKNINFDSHSQGKKKLLKNYITHPSLCLSELTNPNHLIFMVNLLKEMKLLNFLVLDKIYELSVLDLILMKNYDSKQLENTNLYNFLYKNIENILNFSEFEDKYLYYLHIDSIINLIISCPVDIEKINVMIELLCSLKNNDFAKYTKYKIKKNMAVIKDKKIREKNINYVEENLFVFLHSFLSSVDKLSKEFENCLNDKKYL